MLPSLALWLQGLSPEFGSLRVFQYLTFRAVMAAMTALLLGLVAGPFFIRRLAALKTEWQDGAWSLCLTSPAGKATVRLRIAGRHNVRNALAATACALAAGVPLEAVVRGLDEFEPVGGRSRALALQLEGRRVTLIDDTYNANPDSVRAAIDVLAELPGPRLLALGDMGEVGEQGLAFHDEVLRHALARGIEAVHVAGDWMRQASAALPQVVHWVEVPAMAGAVCAVVTDDRPVFRSVLVKGSRFMRTERVVNALLALDPAHDNNKKDNAHAA